MKHNRDNKLRINRETLIWDRLAKLAPLAMLALAAVTGCGTGASTENAEFVGVVLDVEQHLPTLEGELARSVSGETELRMVRSDAATVVHTLSDTSASAHNDLIAEATERKRIGETMMQLGAVPANADRDVFGALATLAGEYRLFSDALGLPADCRVLVLGDGHHHVAGGLSTAALDPDDDGSIDRLLTNLRRAGLRPDLSGCSLEIEGLKVSDSPGSAVLVDFWSRYAASTNAVWAGRGDVVEAQRLETGGSDSALISPPASIGVCSDVSASMDTEGVAAFHEALGGALLNWPTEQVTVETSGPAQGRPALHLQARLIGEASYSPGSLLVDERLPSVPQLDAAPLAYRDESDSDFRRRFQRWEALRQEHLDRDAALRDAALVLASEVATAPLLTADSTDIWGCVAALLEVLESEAPVIVVHSDLAHTAATPPQAIPASTSMLIVLNCDEVTNCAATRKEWAESLGAGGTVRFVRPEQTGQELGRLLARLGMPK